MRLPFVQHRLSSWLCLVGISWLSIYGQSETGVVSGTAVDSSGAVIVGATVALKAEATGVVRTGVSNTSGEFVFSAVSPATYSVRLEKQGFRAYVRSGIVVTASQRLALGTIQLSLGDLAQQVTVVSTGEAVNTESGEPSSLLSARQLDSSIARGRDPINLLKILPGVSQITSDGGGSGGERE